MRLSPIAFLLTCAMASGSELSAQAADAETRSLVEVRVTGPAQLQQLLALDLDLAGCRQPLLGQRRIEIIARPGDLFRVEIFTCPNRGASATPTAPFRTASSKDTNHRALPGEPARILP